MVDFKKIMALERLVVRKDGLLCTQCGVTDPVHPGDGTPAPAFIMAINMAAMRHIDCSVQKAKAASTGR